jgi:hypothetical protein
MCCSAILGRIAVTLGAFVIAIGLLVSCTPAFADVACVQRELTRIGLDPGPADGQLGRKTLQAAKTYQEGAAYLQDLSTVTSSNWCTFLKNSRRWRRSIPISRSAALARLRIPRWTRRQS